MIKGWRAKYLEILKEFGYDEDADIRAARMLDSEISEPVQESVLYRLLRGRTAFVAGAGPSIHRTARYMKEFPCAAKIVADGALAAFAENGIAPDVIVTDLDGDLNLLKDARYAECIFVVHAHGDNIPRLHHARCFVRRIGTTQSKDMGSIHNWGGFTDGDRAVFLAEHFGASRIILFGMDMGSRIGRYSFTPRHDRETKLKKLQTAQALLEWLATRTNSKICTMSRPFQGIRGIGYSDLEGMF